MGYRKNHQFKFKQMNIEIKRFYSSKVHQSYIKKHNLCTPINPWWVTGFWDGEGCFVCSIREDKNLKLVPPPP